MKHIKPYKYHPSYSKWAVDYWESGIEKFPNIQITKDAFRYLKLIFPFTENDNYVSAGYYADKMSYYFKDYADKNVIDKFKQFLKDNKLKITSTKHYDKVKNIEYTVTTSHSNFKKLSELYNNINKFNL